MNGTLMTDRHWSIQPFLDSWLRAGDRPFTPTARPAVPLRRAMPAHLLRPPERRHEFQGRDTPYVRRTIQVRRRTTPPRSVSASALFIKSTVRCAVESSRDPRQATQSVDHTPTEVGLTGPCADVSKLHLLPAAPRRQSGPVAVGQCLTPDSAQPSLLPCLPDHCPWQC